MLNLLTRPTVALAAMVTLLCPLPVRYAAAQAASAQQAPDNSGRNKKENQSNVADQQPNAKEDRLTTAKIRKVVIADKSLSMYAHNVKIITVGGAVTLKGPVRSEDEKSKVASDAASVVSADKVTNSLMVKH